MADYAFIDTESHNAGLEYSHSAREHFRLGQYAINDGPVVLTEDYDEFVRVVRAADYVVGHNIIGYDLSYLFGVDSLEPLQMCLDRKVIDTFVIASLVTPAPYSYTNSAGHTFYGASKPEVAMKYLALDNLAHQFNLPGKVGDLTQLAKKYNPPKTLVDDLDYSLIPLDDPEFREYAEGDVIAARALWRYFLRLIKEQGYRGDYIWREFEIAGLNAQIHRNGMRVDTDPAKERVSELAEERDEVMSWLVSQFAMPTSGKQPWKSDAGKQAILEAMKDFGITPDMEAWERTASGAPSFGGKVMLAISEGTEAESLGRALATLQGQRSLAQLALDSTHPDGKVHPSITTLQRSGRTSIQKPGLTVWTAHGPNAVEKRYFIADEGTKMFEVDFSAADARAVAAVSGDPEFARRLEPGADPHEITGRIFFGDEVYESDTGKYRQLAKIANHSMAYRVGSKKLADSLGVRVDEAKEFIRLYKEAYPWVALWQDAITAEGEEYGYVTNAWGRRMMVDEGRSFTQSSALIGQSTTREILFDGLLRIVKSDIERARWIRATIHDAVVFCLPEQGAEEHAKWVCQQMSTVFDPGTKVSQPIEFSVSHGKLASNWFEAGH